VSSDEPDIELLAAALRADETDVSAFTRVVVATLGGTLPPGLVEVERKRTMADRLSGRDGEPVAVRARFDTRELELRRGPAGAETEIRTGVRGVVLSRRRVPVSEWVRALAEELAALAAHSADARAALGRLLGT
jgi:hypothetical protein